MKGISKKEIKEHLLSLKSDDNYSYYMSVNCEETEGEGLSLTYSCNDEMTEWNWQSGDNSYTGGAYGLPHWAVVNVQLRDNVNDIVNEIFSQWGELTQYHRDFN